MKSFQTGSIINKRNDSIRKLSENLFSKFEGLSKNMTTDEDALSKFAYEYTPILNPVQNLISKANTVTKNGENKINMAKKSKKLEETNTFLTGTGHCQNERCHMPKQQIEVPQAQSHMEILKNLMQNQDMDDLAQLRKMLKQTGQNIESCRRKVYKTQKTIINYTSGLNLDTKKSAGINSMNKIIGKYR